MALDISGFFRDISNSLRSRSVLGVDIGTASIKLVEISERGGSFTLENYGILEEKSYLLHPNRAIQTSSYKINDREVGRLLKILVREVRPKTKIALASLPLFSVFSTYLDMPLLSEQETAEAVSYQARQYIPLSLSEVSLDWFKVEEFYTPRGERFQKILLIGIPKELVLRYRAIFKAAGLSVTELEIESFSLVRALFRGHAGKTALIDIGAESTSFFIVENGIMRAMKQIDAGGINVTRSLGDGLGLSVYRAEELKRRRGLQGFGGESELSTLIASSLNVIIQETKKLIAAYEENSKKKIEGVMAVGGGANLKGFTEYLERELELPVLSAPTWSGVRFPSDVTVVQKDLENRLPIAVGLAKKYFS